MAGDSGDGKRGAVMPRDQAAAGCGQGRSRGIRHVLTILGDPFGSARMSTELREPVPPAAWRARHRDAVLSAEIRRLVRLTRAVGPLSRPQLARLAHAERWREGGFEAAVESAIASGELRPLAFGYLAVPRLDDEAERISRRRSAARPGRSRSR
jgi:hypothetical protein